MNFKLKFSTVIAYIALWLHVIVLLLCYTCQANRHYSRNFYPWERRSYEDIDLEKQYGMNKPWDHYYEKPVSERLYGMQNYQPIDYTMNGMNTYNPNFQPMLRNYNQDYSDFSPSRYNDHPTTNVAYFNPNDGYYYLKPQNNLMYDNMPRKYDLHQSTLNNQMNEGTNFQRVDSDGGKRHHSGSMNNQKQNNENK